MGGGARQRRRRRERAEAATDEQSEDLGAVECPAPDQEEGEQLLPLADQPKSTDAPEPLVRAFVRSANVFSGARSARSGQTTGTPPRDGRAPRAKDGEETGLGWQDEEWRTQTPWHVKDGSDYKGNVGGAKTDGTENYGSRGRKGEGKGSPAPRWEGTAACSSNDSPIPVPCTAKVQGGAKRLRPVPKILARRDRAGSEPIPDFRIPRPPKAPRLEPDIRERTFSEPVPPWRGPVKSRLWPRAPVLPPTKEAFEKCIQSKAEEDGGVGCRDRRAEEKACWAAARAELYHSEKTTALLTLGFQEHEVTSHYAVAIRATQRLSASTTEEGTTQILQAERVLVARFLASRSVEHFEVGPDCGLTLVRKFLGGHDAEIWMSNLRRFLLLKTWRDDYPLSAFMTQTPCVCSYKYHANAPPTGPMPMDFFALARQLVALDLPGAATLPNSANINHYPSGRSWLPWHADNEELFQADRQPSSIMSVSFGAPREFQYAIKGKEKDPKSIKSIILEEGDVLCMSGLFQRHFLHRVPPAQAGERFNITYRNIVKHELHCPVRLQRLQPRQ